jgi:hypothetical protein
MRPRVGQIFSLKNSLPELMKYEPYSRHAIHRITQAEDGVFGGQHGELSMARLQALDSQKLAAGLHAELVTFVDIPPLLRPQPGATVARSARLHRNRIETDTVLGREKRSKPQPRTNPKSPGPPENYFASVAATASPPFFPRRRNA